jgi:hypothetical protein
MTLEEHRIGLLKRITECAGAQVVRDLIAEADLLLVCCHLQPSTLHKFWTELRADLDVLQEELVYVRDSERRALRGSIIAAALVATTGLVNKLADPVGESAGNS